MLNSYYKYTNTDTAKAILTHQSFRFSSPINFNDPFDIQSKLYTEFDINTFSSIVMSRIKDYVKGKRLIPDSRSSEGNGISDLKKAIELTGIHESKIEPFLIPLIEEATKRFKKSLDYHNAVWLKGMKQSRVFCVTETNDNLLMWSHYAQDHRGVVFEIENINEEGNILSTIKSVSYNDKPISYFSLEELINWTIFQIEPDFSKIMYSAHAWHKSKHWEYEKEWRVVEICCESETPKLYLDRKFIPKQLKSIIFGCKTSDEHIQNIRLFTPIMKLK